ncbi:ABC transporter permease [Tunicatimonas pelagia]|uniref:ABC transporter permease n=1 Tax=Tunicatimonas pelagia TaxID=931531 RepID=UPI002666F52F|nr:ABC transporter permease [Tunicatimonas pelagia]WKN41478.1 ABC transporter permease [Tunicatimonas pelagia]
MSKGGKDSKSPPLWATRFLRWYCRPELLDEVEGDLYELFRRRVEAKWLRRAQLLYWFNVLMFLHPDYIRKRKYYPTNHTAMFKNYFTIALRNIQKHQSFAAINIAGLTLGIAGALVIFLLVSFELSFDTFHPQADRIYRVLTGNPDEVREEGDTGTPTGLMPVIENEFTGIENVAVAYRLNPAQTQVKINEELTRELHIYFITPSFFEIFHFPWKVGDPKKSLSESGQVAISEALADKYFDGDALGKRMKLNNEYDLIVSGIIQDTPLNTDMPIEIAVSYATFQQKGGYQAEYDLSTNSYHHTYVLLNEGTNPSEVETQFHATISKYVSQEVADEKTTHVLQPLSEIHYNGDIGSTNFSKRSISKSTITSLSLIGFFLLVTACINFVNLATAQAVKRSKEVGIRKVLGSTRHQMIGQFMSETFTLTLIALLLAYLIVVMVFPYLPNLLGVTLDISWLYQPLTLLIAFGISLAVGVLAGFYPSVVLARFRPAATLKNTLTNQQTGGVNLRRGLIIFQFALSQMLIICTIVVVSQMHYFNTTALGFDKEAVVVVEIPESNPSTLQALRNTTAQNSAIEATSFSLNAPSATINKWWTGYTFEKTPNEEQSTEIKLIDEHYIHLYNIPLLAGRNLQSSDSTQILVNETFLKDNGIQNPQDALGTIVSFYGLKAPITGVVKDFHSLSLQQEIPSVVMARFPNMFQQASFKINMLQASEAIAHIEQQWKEIFPEYYFTYQFLDEDLATLYEKEQRTSRLLSLFAGIAIFIGCLGLYGLISFITAQRTKEMGIQKVLGATVLHIVYLFTKDLLLLVGIAFVVAAPLGYYFMQQWLADFTYKIDLAWWMFLIAALVGLLIALVTVSFRSIRAAVANPVDSLRNE